MSRVITRGPTADHVPPTASACVQFGFHLLANLALAQTLETRPHTGALRRRTLDQLAVGRVGDARRAACGMSTWR